MKKIVRCQWATSHELFIPYHDDEWGIPVHDDRQLFEMLNLEGAQAGLSWLTILKKREGYRRAFDHFDAHKIAKYNARKRERLLKDEGIVRNKLKINAVIVNAKAFLNIQKEFGSFDKYIWQFVDGKPLMDGTQPGTSPESDAMSKDLKKRGFKFVGSTVCYAFMQSVGMVNDHSPECYKAQRRKKK
jgi:DNA-3-methyladenine glycosylase I